MLKRCLLLLFATTTIFAQSPDNSALAWQPWSDAAFAKAKQQHKFVLLDLEAVWCHWCHVMEKTTYRDPEVVRLLTSKYVLIRADQDARPDLSNRYEDYGWPATVVFDADAHELVKRQGYIAPKEMAAMLQAVLDDPTPGPSVVPQKRLAVAASATLSPDLRNLLERSYRKQFDQKNAGWGFSHKYLEPASMELSLQLADAGDRDAERMARRTLTAARTLIDPAWGGVYQYSATSDWREPHFEKIMQMQADSMRLYALAYERWHDPADLHSALAIHRYLVTFLRSPEGAFYVSQDADLVQGVHSAPYFALADRQRRARGIPRIDKHTYARENGWAIEALAELYSATKNRSYLDEATTAADWVLAHRSLLGGGFSHSENDAAGPYLGDSVAMARASLALYRVTGDAKWMDHARRTLSYIHETFASPDHAGYLTAKAHDRFAPQPERDENISVARTAAAVYQMTKNESVKEILDSALRYLNTPEIAKQFPAAGTLLAYSGLDQK